MKKLIMGLLFSLLPIASHAALSPAALNQVPTGLTAVLKQVLPTVVNISAQVEISVLPNNPGDQNHQPAGPEQQPPQDPQGMPQPPPIKREIESYGSGVIADAKQGYILTNAHVIDRAKTINVTLSDGRKFTAKLIGSDPPSDVAVIQIKAEVLSAAPFGDSEALEVGQPVIAVGSPFGLSQTVTSGIISGLQRSALNIENYENFIQTDASINPGNSGGPLVDMQGRVIGINTAILAPGGGNIGIGFAIPSNMARSVMAQLIQYGSVRRGLMGVMVNDLTPDLASAFHTKPNQGAVVALVVPGSPAEKSGIKVGDIILKVNAKPMKDASDVRNTVGLLRVGATVTLELLREGNKSQTITMVTADPEKYQKDATADNPLLSGTVLRDFDDLTAEHGRVKGVALVHVKRDSIAWRSGLRRGDVIVSANRTPVTNIDQLVQIARQNKQQLLLNVHRGNGAMFLVVK